MASSTDEFYDYCSREIFAENNARSRYQHWFVLPAVLIIAGYCFLEKRKNVKKDLLWGRPGIVKPFSFLDEYSNRWGIMLVFGSITGNIIQITQKTFSATFPIWAKIFLIYILTLEQSVVCFPLFASMTNRHKLVGAIVGLLYSMGWFAFEMFTSIQNGRCFAKYQVKHTNVAAHTLIQEFPIMLCNFLLILKFCHKIYKCIKKKNFQSKSEVKLCSSDNIVYVTHLFRGSHLEKDDSTKLTLRVKLQRKFLRPVPGFRYPISILITVFMSLIMLYMVGLFCAETMELFYKNGFLEEYLDLFTASNVIATITTFSIGFRNIYVMTANYKRDILLLLRGDRSFIPKTVLSPLPSVYMARGIRFVGTAIVGMLWGAVISYLTIFVPLSLTMLVFRLLKQRDKLDDLLHQFEWMLYPVLMVIVFQLQIRLINWFLIQPKLEETDKYRPLAVDNRNFYDILAFFALFLNASIGLFLFLRRILTGALLGMFLIPRMDRSLLMQGYEGMDKCYVNYIGMLIVDATHNNPTMRVFCHIVKQSVVNKYSTSKPTVENPVYVTHEGLTRVEDKNTTARKKWFLAYTLLKNPNLRDMRRKNFQQPEVNIGDIETSVEEPEEETDKTGRCKIKCCKNRKCTIPPNISTSCIAIVVLLMFAILYAGVPILLSDLQ